MLPAPPIITANNISKIYPMKGAPVLNRVDLAIHPGEWLNLFGQSGSGKTTLLGILAGLDLHYTGVVTAFDQDLKKLSDEKLSLLRARAFGFVFQAFHLLPNLDVLANVLVPSIFATQPQATSRALDALESVGMSDLAHSRVQHLSGGQKQRVAVARAIAFAPQVVFCDEPTGQLDDSNANLVAEALETLRRTHDTAIVCATHDSRLASHAHRTLSLSEGKCHPLTTTEDEP